MESPSLESHQWFVTEVRPHRPALRAWLLARFPTLPDVDDVVDESVARVFRARQTMSIQSPRALLFSTARNLALDLVRRQKIVVFESITDETDLSDFTDSGDVVEIINPIGFQCGSEGSTLVYCV